MTEMNRRTFLRASSAAAVVGLHSPRLLASPGPSVSDERLERVLSGLAEIARDEARAAGAEAAEVRVSRHVREVVAWPDETGCGVRSTVGTGVRATVDGQWGFGAASGQSAESAARAARRAVDRARWGESQPTLEEPCGWDAHVEADSSTGARWERVQLAVREVSTIAGVTHVQTSMIREHDLKAYADSSGRLVVFGVERSWIPLRLGASRGERSAVIVNPYAPRAGRLGRDAKNFPEALRARAEELVHTLSAPRVSPIRTTVVLGPDLHASLLQHLLTVPGFGPNQELGSTSLAITADRAGKETLAWCTLDDRGNEPRVWDVVREGLVVDRPWTRPSETGLAWASSWASEPRARFPNWRVAPGSPGLGALVGEVGQGVFVSGEPRITRGSSSIHIRPAVTQAIRYGQIDGLLGPVEFELPLTLPLGRLATIGGKNAVEAWGPMWSAFQPEPRPGFSIVTPPVTLDGIRIRPA